MSKKLLAGLGLFAASMVSAEMASAQQAGDLFVRARGIYVAPHESATTSIGGTVDIDNKIVPEVDFTYFVADNIGVELIAATTKHNVAGIGTALGASADLGSAWLLPPTLSLQYHVPTGTGFKPYFGAGVNYTFFYSEKAAGGAITGFNLKDSFGFSLQAGADFEIAEDTFINLDVKKLFLRTDASINGGAVTAKVKIDPWIIGAGIGKKF
ncbi:MAG: OmpW family protein [Alphaproteobacteria bacterium]|nr:OmpW family protein [Alphaproteobacteria bacterium]HPF46704.1 OmpW family protein [Emcibacteraceae bacterium]HRW29988.1 OmpW family protein [Emcibacteraceae bacterium]